MACALQNGKGGYGERGGPRGVWEGGGDQAAARSWRAVSVPLFSQRLPLSESNSSSPWLGGLGQSLAGMARGHFTFAPRALPCLVPAARRL